MSDEYRSSNATSKTKLCASKSDLNYYDGTTSRNTLLHSYLSEIQAQFQISIPTIISFFLYKIPWLVSLHFAGTLGPENLAAAALATTFCNVTGMSASVGLSSALSTLTGQSRGSLIKDNRDGDDDDHNIYFDAGDGVCLLERGGDGISVDSDNNDNDDVFSDNVQVRGSDMRGLGLGPEFYLISESSSSECSEQCNNSHHKGYNTITDDHLSLTTGESLGEDEHHHRQQQPRKYDRKLSNISYDSVKEVPHAHPPLQPLVYLYRGILIQMLIVLPVGIYWLYGIGPLLLALGQKEELAEITENYLRILTPGLWAYSINWTVYYWLQCIDMADVPAYAAFIGCAFHVPFNILFVHKLGFGISGVAMATVTFQLIQPFCMFIYIFHTSHGIRRVLLGTGATNVGITNLGTHSELLYAATSSLSGILQYLALALPGMVAISEWWASEIAILLAGRLHPNPSYALAGMSIYQSINSFCFMFPCGFGAAASTRIGTALGRDYPRGARLACRVGIASATCCSAILGCIIYFTPHVAIPSFFTEDEDVLSVTVTTLPYLAIYVFADGISATLGGVVKGCGRQTILMPIVLFAYWVVGLPVGYYLTFVRNGGNTMCTIENNDGEDYSPFGCGVVGLVIGLTSGTWVHCILLALTVYISVDWSVEAERAQERLALEMELLVRRDDSDKDGDKNDNN